MSWFLCMAMDCIFPSVPGLKGVKEANLAPFLRRFSRESTFLTRFGLVLSAWFFIWAPVLTVYIPLPLFFLPARLRDLHAQRASVHRFYLMRQTTLMLKMIGGLCLGQDPEVREQLGLEPYTGDPGTFRTGSDESP